jgi:hypothetical protein
MNRAGITRALRSQTTEARVAKESADAYATRQPGSGEKQATGGTDSDLRRAGTSLPMATSTDDAVGGPPRNAAKFNAALGNSPLARRSRANSLRWSATCQFLPVIRRSRRTNGPWRADRVAAGRAAGIRTVRSRHSKYDGLAAESSSSDTNHRRESRELPETFFCMGACAAEKADD